MQKKNSGLTRQGWEDNLCGKDDRKKLLGKEQEVDNGKEDIILTAFLSYNFRSILPDFVLPPNLPRTQLLKIFQE